MRSFQGLGSITLVMVWCWTGSAAAQYHDDFEDEQVGSLPSHWMESEEDERWNAAPNHWRVVAAEDHPGARVLLADELEGERKAQLHTFGSNVQLDVDFQVVNHAKDPKAQLSFLLRANSDKDRIELSYQFSTRQWEVRERTGIVEKRGDGKLVNNPSRLLATTVAPLPKGWNHLEIEVIQTTLIAKLNAEELLTAIKLEHLNFGRVGFEVRNARVMFDNVTYAGDGEGRVHDGVKEIGNMHNELYSDIFETPDGKLTVKSNPSPWGVLQSSDDGDTWKFLTGNGLSERELNQVVVLDNGHIVDISSKEVERGKWAYDAKLSLDNGATWSAPVRLPRDPIKVYMEPGRLQLTDSGRLFFVIDYTRKKGSQLYYSDDEGKHWKSGAAFTPATHAAIFRKVKRFEAPHVVNCGSGRVATFFRSNRDYHYRSISDDDGLTWSEPFPVFTLRSSLSDAAFAYDDSDHSIYAVWLYELRRDPPGCKTEGQWPRERMVLTRSTDCGATWSYLMDVDNWEGNDARFNQMVMRIIGDHIWISADTHVAAAPNSCGGAAYAKAVKPNMRYDWRRLYRIDKRKLEPLPRMPLLLTR